MKKLTKEMIVEVLKSEQQTEVVWDDKKKKWYLILHEDKFEAFADELLKLESLQEVDINTPFFGNSGATIPMKEESKDEKLKAKCYTIYNKVKESWTPDKRSFEEAEVDAKSKDEYRSAEEILNTKYIFYSFPAIGSMTQTENTYKTSIVLECMHEFHNQFASQGKDVTDEEKQCMAGAISMIQGITENVEELNMANYTEEQVRSLNDAMIEVYQIVHPQNNSRQ